MTSKRPPIKNPEKYNCRSIKFPKRGVMNVVGNSGKKYLVKASGAQWFIMNIKYHDEFINSIQALKYISQNEPKEAINKCHVT